MQEKYKEIDILKLLDTEEEGDGWKTGCSLGIRRIVYVTGNEESNIDEAYEIRTCIGRKTDRRVYTLSQLAKQKVLPEFEMFVSNISRFYRDFRKEILKTEFTDDDTSYETARNGLQEVNGRWMYVFGNGSIDAAGFRTNIKSKMGGIYFPQAKIAGRQEGIENIRKLFQVYRANPPVFYPLFLINIMGITNGYFREIGEGNFMRLSLWLDGASGSGKTELAKAGTYIFGDREFNQKLMVSVTGKRKDVFVMLLCASGCVGVMDDVKQEDVRERKNSVNNNTDDGIRSVFRGELTDSVSGYAGCKKIDCCMIITGEYISTKESQNARILYLRTDGFLKDKKNAEALRCLQGQPELLSSVCGGYIQFLLRKMEESSFPELVKAKLKEIRKSEMIYQGIANAERLQENRCMLEMAVWMTGEYFHGVGIEDAFISDFHEKAEKSIEEAMDDTYYLLGGGQMILQKVMEHILLKARIRKAYYRKTFGRSSKWKYYQEYFWIDKDQDDFLWVEDYKKSMQKDEKENFYDYDDNPVLLISRMRLEELFQKEIRTLLEEKGKISSKTAGSVINQFWKMMREMRIIYQTRREDSELGRPAAEYPVFKRYIEHGFSERPFYMMGFEPTVQINTGHPCVNKLAERMKNTEGEDTLGDAVDTEIVDMQDDKQLERDAIYEKRRKFIRGKLLYRK